MTLEAYFQAQEETWVPNPHGAIKQRAPWECLGFRKGDEHPTQLHRDFFINHEIKDPVIKQSGFNGKQECFSFFFSWLTYVDTWHDMNHSPKDDMKSTYYTYIYHHVTKTATVEVDSTLQLHFRDFLKIVQTNLVFGIMGCWRVFKTKRWHEIHIYGTLYLHLPSFSIKINQANVGKQ